MTSTGSLKDLEGALQARLDQLAADTGVVGAVVAVQQGDKTVSAATGLTNVRTGQPVTTDTIFQVGSITKVYTATLVMQLVDEGLVDLDQPVASYLPDFTTADKSAAATVTTRQLLSHTSGMDGDVFDDFGRGDDCIEKYVAGMSTLAQTSPPGAFFSYCNSGFVLLGRLVEHFRGMSWDAALRKHLLTPLGLTDTVTLPDEAILRPVAVGHLGTGENGAQQVAPIYHLTRALGPAGVVTAPAAEVLAFARMHLNDGAAPDGTQVLSPASVKAMRELQVRMDDPLTLGDGWGLGWILYTLGNPPVIGHDGSTIGQQAYMRIVPDHDLVIVLLSNGGGMGALFEKLVRPLLRELVGAELNGLPEPKTGVDVDVTPFLGIFERAGVHTTIRRDDDGKLWIESKPTGPLAAALPAEPPRELLPLDETTLITAESDPRIGRHITMKFLEPSEAGFRYVHAGARATPRVSD
jgi:CubicO group peptidase (beta-lactamase class C family)